MILGFVLGWCAATYWWTWMLSFYDKPLPPRQSGNGRVSTVTTFSAPHWPKDGGP